MYSMPRTIYHPLHTHAARCTVLCGLQEPLKIKKIKNRHLYLNQDEIILILKDAFLPPKSLPIPVIDSNNFKHTREKFY